MKRIAHTIIFTAAAWAALFGLTGCGTDPASPAPTPTATHAPKPAPVTVAPAAGPVGKPTDLSIPAIGVTSACTPWV